jgi:molybdopterin-guanine dinucleotide biosynthesis protein A
VSEPLAVVLAGGRSSRMGRSKATVELAGRPLAAWALAAAAGAGLDAVVVAKRATELPTLAVPVWIEPEAPSHPLTGLVAALERAAPRPVIALACDMPFVGAALLRLLAGLDAVAAAPFADGRLHPFPGLYAEPALPALREGLEREAPVREVLAALAPALVTEEELRALGDPRRLLLGVNDPWALERAAALAG